MRIRLAVSSSANVAGAAAAEEAEEVAKKEGSANICTRLEAQVHKAEPGGGTVAASSGHLRLWVRVQRGPQWEFGGGEEDGGVGTDAVPNVGTVVGYYRDEADAKKAGQPDESQVGDAPSFSGMCKVVWDRDVEGETEAFEYKIGRRGKLQLKFSNDQVGGFSNDHAK